MFVEESRGVIRRETAHNDYRIAGTLGPREVGGWGGSAVDKTVIWGLGVCVST